MSRQTTRPRRLLAPAVAIGIGALLGVVGCSAGQVAQTADMEPAVNGNTGQAGPIALRDVQVAYPENGEAYRVGEDAPLTLAIINSGATDDELVGVSSPAGKVEIIGNVKLPGRTSLQIVVPGENPAASSSAEAPSTSESTGSSESPESSGSPATEAGSPTTETNGAEPTGTVPDEPLPVGTASLVITGLTGDLPYGKTVPVTFEFAHAGKVTIQLPVAVSDSPRTDTTHAVEEGEN